MTIDEAAEELIVPVLTPSAPSTSPFSVSALKTAIDEALATIEPGNSGAFLTTVKLDPATGTFTVRGAVAVRMNDVWSIGATFDVPPTHVHDSVGFVGVKASWR
jgi:hypothetical protein